jgi:hypothetical protein
VVAGLLQVCAIGESAHASVKDQVKVGDIIAAARAPLDTSAAFDGTFATLGHLRRIISRLETHVVVLVLFHDPKVNYAAEGGAGGRPAARDDAAPGSRLNPIDLIDSDVSDSEHEDEGEDADEDEDDSTAYLSEEVEASSDDGEAADDGSPPQSGKMLPALLTLWSCTPSSCLLVACISQRFKFCRPCPRLS